MTTKRWARAAGVILGSWLVVGGSSPVLAQVVASPELGVGRASTGDPACESGWIRRVELSGAEKTQPRTILALLPRPAPARFTRAELAEFERRLNNLGVFDSAGVECRAGVLQVSVREKWTIVPNLDFSTGRSLADTYALLGASEYNLLGTAHQLGLKVSRERRGFGLSASFNEHDYQRDEWAFGSELTLGTVAIPLGESGGWRLTSTTLDLSFRSPPWLHEYFNYIAGTYLSYERVHAVQGVGAPPSSNVAQSYFGFSWDGYEWHDLVPSGLQASLWFSIGGLLAAGSAQPRHTAELFLRGAQPLGGHTVILGRVEATVGTRGNVNYGIPLGSVDGVRGLQDAQYFNWIQVLSNLELRHSLSLWPRWALQEVAFVDGALFEPMSIEGHRSQALAALGAGLGLRLVPTWISNLLLRLDGARLFEPDPTWFGQVGLQQYF